MIVFCIANFGDPYLSEFSIFFEKLNGFGKISTRATMQPRTIFDFIYIVGSKITCVHTYVIFSLVKTGTVINPKMPKNVKCVDPYLKN